MASRKSYTICEKMKILQKYDERKKNASAKTIAHECGISASTLNTMLKDRVRITEKAKEGGIKIRKMKQCRHAELEKVLYAWFSQARDSCIPLNGAIVRIKAKDIANKLGIKNFNASNGWLDRFKQRHRLVYRKIRREAKDVNEDVKTWQEHIIPTLMEEYAPKDIFNADELGLFFRILPDKSYVYNKQSCAGGKFSKERLTVLLAANCDGSEKLKPLVIGKSKKPLCFANVKHFSCQYVNQRRAWMTGELFTDWLKSIDKKMIAKKRKILLFVDNCPAHPSVLHLENVKVAFLPPNDTSTLQPMDQGVIRCFKQRYRKNLILRHIQQIDKPASISCKTSNVLDAIVFIQEAWNEVSRETIANCFKKAGFVKATTDSALSATEENVTDTCVDTLLTGLGKTKFEDYVNIDSNVICYEEPNIDEIINDNCQSDDESEKNNTNDDPTPTLHQAIQALETLRCYVHSISDEGENILYLYKLEREIIKKNIHVFQTKIDDFFG